MVNFDESKNWTHYLTRPYSLFGCSLWCIWYADYAQKFASVDISETICIEETPGVVRNYRVKEHLDDLAEQMGRIASTDREKAISLLKQAEDYNNQATNYLEHGSNFENLESASKFFSELALYATIIPHFLVLGLQKLNKKDDEIEKLAIRIRGISLYPRIMSEKLFPLAEHRAIELGAAQPKQCAELSTLDELIRGDISAATERIKHRNEGKKFILVADNHKIKIDWLSDTEKYIESLEGANFENVIKGSTAYKGRVVGTARVVKSYDSKDILFNEGDILVSINSNPNLMDLITKASALVTDEGGVTCHAAIISRELKKPCIIGTKNATRIIKNGDEIEVDADRGTITIQK